MKIRNGIDLCEINRMLKHVDSSNTSFFTRCFTPAEIEYAETHKSAFKKAESYAGRYAAKEACGKAFGTGVCTKDIALTDIEVVVDENGAPEIRLHNGALEFAKNTGVMSIAVSITHEKEYAAAAVTMLTNEENI